MFDINKQPDEEIIKIVKSGNKELYAEIIKRYQIKLTRYATYLIGDKTKAIDAVQDAFIKAYINLNSFNMKKKFSSWIYRIVHNEAINIYTKNRKEISIPAAFEFQSKENIEEYIIGKETQDKVKKCLSQMPLSYSEPLSLFYLEEKSYEEISDILHLPINTVGTRINRAKVIMKTICKTKN